MDHKSKITFYRRLSNDDNFRQKIMQNSCRLRQKNIFREKSENKGYEQNDSISKINKSRIKSNHNIIYPTIQQSSKETLIKDNTLNNIKNEKGNFEKILFKKLSNFSENFQNNNKSDYQTLTISDNEFSKNVKNNRVFFNSRNVIKIRQKKNDGSKEKFLDKINDISKNTTIENNNIINNNTNTINDNSYNVGSNFTNYLRKGISLYTSNKINPKGFIKSDNALKKRRVNSNLDINVNNINNDTTESKNLNDNNIFINKNFNNNITKHNSNNNILKKDSNIIIKKDPYNNIKKDSNSSIKKYYNHAILKKDSNNSTILKKDSTNNILKNDSKNNNNSETNLKRNFKSFYTSNKGQVKINNTAFHRRLATQNYDINNNIFNKTNTKTTTDDNTNDNNINDNNTNDNNTNDNNTTNDNEETENKKKTYKSRYIPKANFSNAKTTILSPIKITQHHLQTGILTTLGQKPYTRLSKLNIPKTPYFRNHVNNGRIIFTSILSDFQDSYINGIDTKKIKENFYDNTIDYDIKKNDEKKNSKNKKYFSKKNDEYEIIDKENEKEENTKNKNNIDEQINDNKRSSTKDSEKVRTNISIRESVKKLYGRKSKNVNAIDKYITDFYLDLIYLSNSTENSKIYELLINDFNQKYIIKYNEDDFPNNNNNFIYCFKFFCIFLTPLLFITKTKELYIDKKEKIKLYISHYIYSSLCYIGQNNFSSIKIKKYISTFPQTNDNKKISILECTTSIVKLILSENKNYDPLRNCLCQILKKILDESVNEIIKKLNEIILYCYNHKSKPKVNPKNYYCPFVRKRHDSIGHENENNIETTVPFIKSQKLKDYCLVLDIDETIAHTLKLNFGNYFLLRPGTIDFLTELSNYYEIVIFTSSIKNYADNIIDKIDIAGNLIAHRLYKNHVVFENGKGFKKLDMIGRDLKKIIFVDNLKSNAKYNIKNLCHVSTWINDPYDTELIVLKDKLKYIVTSGKYKDDITKGI